MGDGDVFVAVHIACLIGDVVAGRSCLLHPWFPRRVGSARTPSYAGDIPDDTALRELLELHGDY